MVDFGGIGSDGPENCPICMQKTMWLTDPNETVNSAYQCGTCLRIFDYYLGLCIWWPNDQDVAPSHGGAADKVYTIRPPTLKMQRLPDRLFTREEEEYPPGTRIRYRYV